MPRIGLFGSYHSKVRNIFPFLEAIHAFENVRFVLRGDSDVEISPESYPNLDFHPGRRPVAEIEELERDCDILLCLGAYSGCIQPAGKVFYYADYRKPIVYISDGANADFFKSYLSEFGRYVICDNTPEAIVAAVNNAIAMLPDFHLTIPPRLEPRNCAAAVIGCKKDCLD